MPTSAPIELRRYRPDDVDPLYEAVVESRQELSVWMPWCHAGYSRQDAEAWVSSRPAAWERNEEWSFVIADRDGRLLGGCGLHRISLRGGVAELGYWVRTSAVRRGAATEATRQLCEWGFREQGLHRIEIIVALENRASRRVAEKAGGVEEGTLRERVRCGDRWCDAVLYSLLAPADERPAC